MIKNKLKRHVELSFSTKTFIGIVSSCLIGTIFTILLSIFFSYILSKSPEISSFISAYFIISVLSGSFVCGFIGSKLMQFKGLLSGLICSVPFLSIMFFIMIFACDGKIMPHVIILFLFIILFSIIGGITSANIKRRK